MLAFICNHTSQLRRVGFIAKQCVVTRPGIYVVHVIFETTLVKCVVPDALQHITNAEGRSFMRLHDIFMYYRDIVDLFIFSRDVLDGGACDF